MNRFKHTLAVAAVLLLAAKGAFAQNEQSAIYDAIALLNASHGINTIMIPDAAGYSMIDPLDGTQSTGGITTALPSALTNGSNSSDIIRQILARNTGLPPGASEVSVRAAYAGNPFLNNLLSGRPITFAGATLPASVNKLLVSPGVGAAGTMLLKNAANGTADFLIKRANEELSVAVIQRLKDFTSHYPEFKVLFPRTVALIKPIEAYDYAKTLNALKGALQEDLDQIPARLPQLYGLPRYQELNARVPVITLMFTASELLEGLSNKSKVSRVIHDLDSCSFLKAENNYASAVRVVILASDNLRKKTLNEAEGTDFSYITAEEIENITHGNVVIKAELTRFFLGLLYQRAGKIILWTSAGPVTGSSLLQAWAALGDQQLSGIMDNLQSVITKIAALNDKLDKLKEYDQTVIQITGRPFLSAERYAVYRDLVSSALTLAAPFISGTDSGAPLKADIIRISRDLPAFADHTTNMVKALRDKEYSLAVDDLAQMLAVVSRFLEERKKDKDFTADAVAAVNANAIKDIAAATAKIDAIDKETAKTSALKPTGPAEKTTVYSQLEALQREKKQLTADLKESEWQKAHPEAYIFTLSKVVEYYKLFAALSQAESGKEVESLLETYALPSGSSRIKKETAFNIALNAYVGGFFARNKTDGAGFTSEYGLTAPIGFTISHGLGKAGSFSLLAGVFDIGGIIRYKLNNQGAYQQDVNLVGLVSPSAHAVYGFPFFLPLSVGAGCQWTTPVTSNSSSINLKPHFNMFLGVDIPLFNLAAGRKHKTP